MQIRDCVKQTATATSDAIYVLTAGVAPAGSVTFAAGFDIPSTGALASAALYYNVPAKVTNAAGAWQIVMGTLERTYPGAVVQLKDCVVMFSSTGSDLGLTGSEAVTVELAVSEASYGLMALKPRPEYTGFADGLGRTGPTPTGAGHPTLFNGGLLAIGADSVASGFNSVVVGDAGATGGNPGVALMGGHRINATTPFAHVGGIGRAMFGTTLNTSQHARGVQNGYTTDATPGQLGTNYGDTLVSLDPGMAIDGITVLEGMISAADTASGDIKVWKFHVAYYTSYDYATTTVVDDDFTVLFASAGASAWAVASSADSGTNYGFIDITGEAATDIVWTATFDVHQHWIAP